MIPGDFTINGIKGSSDLHTLISNFPTIKMPKRKKTLQDIDGSSSSIILDENSYENREMELNLNMRAVDEEDRIMMTSKFYSAFNGDDYLDFVYYGEPNIVYKVTNTDIVEMNRVSINSFDMNIKLKLSAQGFKFYNPSQSYLVTHANPLTLNNRFEFDSEPLLKFRFDGDTVLVINGVKYTYSSNEENYFVDCAIDQQVTYKDDLFDVATFDINQPFPKLKTGINTFTTNADVTVYPRWRLI